MMKNSHFHKIAFIQHELAKAPYSQIYLRIKDFNCIRNKISHQLNYQVSDKEKSKFVDFYMKMTKESKTKPNIDIENIVDLLNFF